MRLSCQYSGDKNDIAGMTVEHRVDGTWQAFDMHPQTPGFEIFVYAILNCQHMYCRVNCAERGLLLASANAEVSIRADQDWKLELMDVGIDGQLASGTPTAGDIDYIIGRMQQCPVSSNIHIPPETHTRLTLS